MFDTDYEINGDVWEVLDSPDLAPYHIIGLAEAPLNGGTMFVRCGSQRTHMLIVPAAR